MHHPDPKANRIPRGLDRGRLPRHPDRPRVRLVDAIEDVHQGGLARAVLSEKAVDLPFPEIKVNPVVGENAAETLRDPLKLDGLFHPSRFPWESSP
jgi:hypothetical protein